MVSITKSLFTNLKAILPVDLPFNILFVFPTLIIPLGNSPNNIMTGNLLEKDLVTTPDQLTQGTNEPLMVTQRAGKLIMIQAKVPAATFYLLQQAAGVSITGALQTMVNLMYDNYAESKALFISSFGVAGIDGNLRITETQIQDGLNPNSPNSSSDQIQLNFKLSFQPPEPSSTIGTLPTADQASLNAIDEAFA
jgi:hypothetical protein